MDKRRFLLAMVKHGRTFDRAWEFDAAMLAHLPAPTIQPTLEYDAKAHKLSGPLLTSVLRAAGATPTASPSSPTGRSSSASR